MAGIVFIIFALLGVPLFAIFGGVALYNYYQAGLHPIAIISEYYKLASQPVLLTIPLFTFAGYLLAESKAPTRLVKVAHAALGWMPGGLAIVTVLSCAFFTAFTGASGVTIIALGGLLYPILVKDGYSDKFSMGLVTSCGSLGLLFPPSLPLILYGLIGKVSIDKLFIAGILPGLVIVFVLKYYSQYMALASNGRRFSMQDGVKILKSDAVILIALAIFGALLGGLYHFFGKVLINDPGLVMVRFLAVLLVLFVVSVVLLAKTLPQNEMVQALRNAIWELPLPVVILVGIYGGFITVSEAAAVAAFYVLVVEVFIYRDLQIFTDIPKIIKESMVLVGGILIILGVAMGLTNYLIDQEVPFKIFNWVSQFITSKWMFLVALNIFLLIVGCMMDIFSAVIVVVPIITPIALKYGVDPIHLAIVFLTNLEIGYITPPVGLNLFISSFRFNRPVFELYRIAIPFLILLLVALLIITYIPWLSLGLLDIMGY
ncbi:MAG: TRAP transporter large permease subunit [Deltaproteobacteria bacterium]|nr:TRAP transporter large permease subunit [Deltaproteobacteria bacterium]